MKEYLYRYKDIKYETHIQIVLDRYEILKKTKKGVWIRYYHGINKEKKFVLLTTRKQFACETVDKAFESFKHRKQQQLKIYKAKVENIKEVLESLEYNINIDKEAVFKCKSPLYFY